MAAKRGFSLRFFLVFRPFHKHIVFYDVGSEELVFRRVLHGQRNLDDIQ